MVEVQCDVCLLPLSYDEAFKGQARHLGCCAVYEADMERFRRRAEHMGLASQRFRFLREIGGGQSEMARRRYNEHELHNTAVQYPRLLAEIWSLLDSEAAAVNRFYTQLQKVMQLPEHLVAEIFKQAVADWERIQEDAECPFPYSSEK